MTPTPSAAQTLDGRYMKLHIALEAFAVGLLRAEEQNQKAPPRLLVTNREAWIQWLKQRTPELRGMLVDPADERRFLGKLQQAMMLPSSDVVADALSRLAPPLTVDATVLAELGRRSHPVHNFLMNKMGSSLVIERDLPRVELLRVVLAALMARASSYEGPIVGWTWDEERLTKPPPPWWPATSPARVKEARDTFACERAEPRQVPSPPPRFSSRIRTNPRTKR